MTEGSELGQKLETRVIPRFNLPTTKKRKNYLGCRTEVRRTTCEHGAVSLHRLLTLFGPVVLKSLSWSDEHAPVKEGAPKRLSQLLGIIATGDWAKASVLLHSLQEKLMTLDTRDLLFHVDNLLIGNLWVDDVCIDCTATLDETGISITALVPLLMDAMEVNFFPTSAVPDTKSGRTPRGTAESSNHPPDGENKSNRRAQAKTQTKASGRGATGKAGQSARIQRS